MKKLLTLLFSAVLALSLTTASFAQDAGGDKKDDAKKADSKEKKAKKKSDKKKGDDKMRAMTK